MTTFDHREAGTPAAAWDAVVAGLPTVSLPASGVRLVVLAAHADDETLGVGGLIATAVAAGREVTVIVGSDGAGSHPGSPTHTRAELARVRRAEAQAAAAALGASLVLLDLPDGHLAEHVDTLSAAAERHARAGDWLLAPWSGDGHPDHVACARAASALPGRRRFEFPVWALHWGGPGLVERRWLAVDLGPAARDAKSGALTCYPSQTRPLSDHPADAAVLPERLLAHFTRGREILIDPVHRPAADSASFDPLWAAGDPWDLETSPYERDKRAAVLAALPRARFARGFEPGAGPGLLTEQLADRVEDLVAWDASPVAVQRAHERGVTLVRRGEIPREWPAGRFDLVVLHEVGYYVRDLDALTGRIDACLTPDDGVLVACHWWHEAPDHPWHGREVHAHLADHPGWRIVGSVREPDFGLDVFTRPAHR